MVTENVNSLSYGGHVEFVAAKKYETTPFAETSGEFIDHWLKTPRNYDRLQHECEKIWSRSSNDPGYDAERAFRVLGQRFIELCRLETPSVVTGKQIIRKGENDNRS